jgi:hypothetical protein
VWLAVKLTVQSSFQVLVFPLPSDTSNEGSDDVELDFEDSGEGDIY